MDKCKKCLIYKESMCTIRCNGTNVSDAECIEKLQKLSRVLHQAGQDMLQDLNRQRGITEEAVKELESIGSCKTCGNLTPFCESNPDSCSGYKWRGPDPQKKTKSEEIFSAPVNQELLQNAKNLIGQLTDAIERVQPVENKPEARGYVDMLNDLIDAIESDVIPDEEKEAITQKLQRVMTVLCKYDVPNGQSNEKGTEEKSYLDMTTELYAGIDANVAIPHAEKQMAIRNLQLVKSILWKYSA